MSNNTNSKMVVPGAKQSADAISSVTGNTTFLSQCSEYHLFSGTG